MSEYIRREDLLEDIENMEENGNCGQLYADEVEAFYGALNAVKSIAKECPSASVVPVRYGHWKLTIDGDDKDGEYHVKAYCSECGQPHMGMNGKPGADILRIKFPEFVSREDAINSTAHAADKAVLWNYCPACGACMAYEEDAK